MNIGIKDRIGVTLAKYNLTVESVFIPFSQSRNSQEKYPSLNWLVILFQGGRKILTTEYSAGRAHAPSYQQPETYESKKAVQVECEKGFPVQGAFLIPNRNKPILPNPADVIYSLMLDSEVSDYESFEEWASSFGYDTDSRQAEQLYTACLKIANRFNSQLSSIVRDELKEVFQDY